MKTRNDFVSNSSSCSFIVKDINGFADKLKELSVGLNGELDTWWLYGLNISFEFKNTPENCEGFKKLLDYYAKRDYPILYVSSSFENFLDIDSKLYSEIMNFRVYAYDDAGYNDVSKLALMYWAMRAEGIDVDNSDSEHEFQPFDTRIPTPIVNAAMKMFQLKQELN